MTAKTRSNKQKLHKPRISQHAQQDTSTFFSNPSLTDFYNYNWNLELVFALFQDIAKATEFSAKMNTYIREFIEPIGDEELKQTYKRYASEQFLKLIKPTYRVALGVGILVLKTLLTRSALRSNKPFLISFAGFISGLTPIIISLVSKQLFDILKQTSQAPANSPVKTVVNISNPKYEQKLKQIGYIKWLVVSGFTIVAVLLSFAPFTQTDKPSILTKFLDKLKQVLAKLYSIVRVFYNKLFNLTRMHIRYHEEKLKSLVQLIEQKEVKLYTARFISGFIVGALIGLGILFGIIAFLLSKNAISAWSFISNLLKDNLATVSLQVATLFGLHMLSQQFKNKKLKSLAVSAHREQSTKQPTKFDFSRILQQFGINKQVSISVSLDSVINEIQTLRASYLTRLGATVLDPSDYISDLYYEKLKNRFRRIKTKFEQLINEQVDLYIYVVSGHVFNAYVVPGRVTHIFVLIGSGFLPYLSELTDDELIALLLHEYGHLIFHTRTQLVVELFAILFMGEVLRMIGSQIYRELESSVLSVYERLIYQFNRLQDLLNILKLMEMEADAYVIAKGYGQHLVSLFRKLGLHNETIEDIFEVHDNPQLRITELEKVVKWYDERKRQGEQFVERLKRSKPAIALYANDTSGQKSRASKTTTT